MKKHHIDRLEKLHAFLGTVKPKKFNFGSWAASKSGTPDVNVCGTTACALGWAGTMPEFRKRGLRLEWDTCDGVIEAEVRLPDTDDPTEYFSGETAGAVFFGLSMREAYYLFIPNSDEAEDMPLSKYRRRLRGFIDRKKKELAAK
jgi:hypothetical protein